MRARIRLLQIRPAKRHPEDRFHALILKRVILCGEEPIDSLFVGLVGIDTAFADV